MKATIDVRFVIDFPNVEVMPEMKAFSEPTIKMLALAGAAQAFEEVFKQMLIEMPDMIKAEVTNIKEYHD